MKILKRDGREAVFDQSKIANAIMMAARDIGVEDDPDVIELSNRIAGVIEDYAHDSKQILTVEQVQDFVENNLMESEYKSIARQYITYRNERTRERERKSLLMQQIGEKMLASDVQNQNANVDEKSFGGRMGEARSIVATKYALDNIVSEMARKHHENNEIYMHDRDAIAVGEHNCLSVPIDELLDNGFKTRQTDVRPAGSVKSAMQLVAVIFQLQSLCQFGGVAATHLDWSMVPYVRKSFSKHYRDGMKYLRHDTAYERDGSKSIVDATYRENEDVYDYAMDMTIEEVHQATEAMFHNLNTLQSRSGKIDCPII